jgi:hypothetical protein
VFDRVKEKFDFPIHFHPEFEVNFIQNGKGVRRIVGDHIEEIDEFELVLVGKFISRLETYKCKEKDIHEITIQFDEKLI